MSSSPRTPSRHHRFSSIDLAYSSASSQGNGGSSPPDVFSQTPSRHEISPPSTPRLDGSTGPKYHTDPSDQGSGNGFGNLADELADAWDEDGDAEPHSLQINQSLAPTKIRTPNQTKHFALRRRNLELDNSDYGEGSDSEKADGSSDSLQVCTAAIQNLTQRVDEANGSDLDGVIKRVADSLKDLPSQSGVENGTTRLMTAHSALTAHLSHQTRSILTLIHAILSPLSAPPDPDMIDEILPPLASLFLILPYPNAQCISSLHSLHTSTTDLQSTLTYLSDTIYMTRQTMTAGTRKLKSASEVLLEMRRELEAKEEAVRWIEKGKWEQRLANRDCAKICVDVVGGFEQVCERWRERLVCGIGIKIGVA